VAPGNLVFLLRGFGEGRRELHPARIVGPVKQCLPLFRAAIHRAVGAIFLQLRDMPAHRAPSLFPSEFV
jgi:hypothetical protein